jgi:asparagine synthase (glutamine-hydrolysing)
MINSFRWQIIRSAAAKTRDQPAQLLGYWSQPNDSLLPSPPSFLAETLQRQLANMTANECGWITTTTEDRVALSAGGLAPDDAWVVVDAHRLILGRDILGRSTLYWTEIDRVIWFSSHLHLLLPLISSPEVDSGGLYGYSCLSYIPTPYSPVRGIRAIASGTTTTWQQQKMETSKQQIWLQNTAQILKTRPTEKASITELQKLLRMVVQQQITDLESTEPVGVFLSGGLDSSIVAALLVEAGVRVIAYTLDFGQHGVSEYPYAAQVANHLNIPLIKVDASPRQVYRSMSSTVRALDVPFGDGVTVPLYLLNLAASQDVRIVFNGEGGDQLFAGWTNKPLIAANVYETGISFEQQYLRTFHRLWGYEERVFQPGFLEQIQQFQPIDWIQQGLGQGLLLDRLRRASILLKGAQNIQPRATNLAVANGLKVRSPFCSLALTEWTFGLDGELYLKGACEKYILKRAVEDLLPAEIVWREKRGMGVPTTAWCTEEWWRSIGHWLNPGLLTAQGDFQADLAIRVALGELGGQIQGRRIGEILWLLISWQLWRETVLDHDKVERSWYHPFWVPHQVWRYHKSWE